jgi:hypothetical protein
MRRPFSFRDGPEAGCAQNRRDVCLDGRTDPRDPRDAVPSAGLLALAMAGHAAAQAVQPNGEVIVTPTTVQIGKDVMGPGSPERMVGALLRAAKTGPDNP